MKGALLLDQMGDEELAAQAQAGSQSHFEELVVRYCHRLFYFLRPRAGNDQDTEDLVQETFLKIYRNLHRFDPAYKFSTWLYTTANRLLISFYRKDKSRRHRFISAAGGCDPQQKMMRKEDSENLWNAARQLPRDQFQALWLRYIEDMPLPDIARVLKKSRVHVRVLLHRARLKLAEQLNPVARAEKNENPEMIERSATKKIVSFL